MKMKIIILIYFIFGFCLSEAEKTWKLEVFPRSEGEEDIELYPGIYTQVYLIFKNLKEKPFSNDNLEYIFKIEDKNIISLDDSIILRPNDNQFYIAYLGLNCGNGLNNGDYTVNISITPNNDDTDENSIVYENISVKIYDDQASIELYYALRYMPLFSFNYFKISSEIYNIQEIIIKPESDYFDFADIVIKPFGKREKIDMNNPNNGILFDYPFKFKENLAFSDVEGEEIEIGFNIINNQEECYYASSYSSINPIKELSVIDENLKKLIKANFQDLTEEYDTFNKIKLNLKILNGPIFIACTLKQKYFFPDDEEYMEPTENSDYLHYKNAIDRADEKGNIELEIKNLEYNSEYFLNCELSDGNYNENNRNKINITIGNYKNADIVHQLKSSRERKRIPQCIKFFFDKNHQISINEFKLFGSKHCIYYMKLSDPRPMINLPTLICEITEGDEETVNLCVSPSPLYSIQEQTEYIEEYDFSLTFDSFIEYVKEHYKAIKSEEREYDIDIDKNTISSALVEYKESSDEIKFTFDILSTNKQKLKCFYYKELKNEITNELIDYESSLTLFPNKKKQIEISLTSDCLDYNIYSLYFNCYNLPDFYYKFESTGYIPVYSFLYLKDKQLDQKTKLDQIKNITINCNKKENQINPICLKTEKFPINKIIKTDFPEIVKELENKALQFSKLSDNAKYVFLENLDKKYEKDADMNELKNFYQKSIEILKYLETMDCSKYSSGISNMENETIKSEKYVNCRNVKQNSMEKIINKLKSKSQNIVDIINSFTDNKLEILKYFLIFIGEMTHNEDSYRKDWSEILIQNSINLSNQFDEYWALIENSLKEKESEEYIKLLEKETLLSIMTILSNLPRIIHFDEIDGYINKNEIYITKTGLILYEKSIEIQEAIINSSKKIKELDDLRYNFNNYTILDFSFKFFEEEEKYIQLNNDIIIYLNRLFINRYYISFIKIFSFDSPLVSFYPKEKIHSFVESNTLNTFIILEFFNEEGEEINLENIYERYRPKILYLKDSYNPLKGCYYYDSKNQLLKTDGMFIKEDFLYNSKHYFECSMSHLAIFTAGTNEVIDKKIIIKDNKGRDKDKNQNNSKFETWKIILILLGIVIFLTIIISIYVEWRKRKRIKSRNISDLDVGEGLLKEELY